MKHSKNLSIVYHITSLFFVNIKEVNIKEVNIKEVYQGGVRARRCNIKEEYQGGRPGHGFSVLPEYPAILRPLGATPCLEYPVKTTKGSERTRVSQRYQIFFPASICKIKPSLIKPIGSNLLSCIPNESQTIPSTITQ
jgi:hypothetical protein